MAYVPSFFFPIFDLLIDDNQRVDLALWIDCPGYGKSDQPSCRVNGKKFWPGRRSAPRTPAAFSSGKCCVFFFRFRPMGGIGLVHPVCAVLTISVICCSCSRRCPRLFTNVMLWRLRMTVCTPFLGLVDSRSTHRQYKEELWLLY